MLRNHGWLTVVTLAIIATSGCSKSEGPATRAGTFAERQNQSAASFSPSANRANMGDPRAACYEFLEAVRTGNDEKAAKMLSSVAREKVDALNRRVTPQASDTARFTLGKVELVGEDGARVESTWTDVDDDGQASTDTTIWALRREAEGWRVAGVAWTVFPGEPPLVLNFEDPEEMVKKQQWIKEEIRRRAEKDNLQAKEAGGPENSMRR
jgi:hypothetical protein